mmetsp:Transcript_11113/g.18644  ORF Transcript_11113/g.18644 Transcript_11113/m.18644 type:complete len:110 (+) Transcript_11113:728-1057(+)
MKEEDYTEENLEEKFKGMKDHPFWFKELARWTWKNQVSPFGVNRFLGQKQSYQMFQGYIERKWMPTVKKEQQDGIADYMFQIFMRDGTTEYAPMINFSLTLKAHLPLGT